MSDGSDIKTATALYTDVDTGRLKERRFRVTVVGGPDEGRDHILEAGTAMVGTHPNNDFVLSDDTVSRYHLELQARRDGLLVVDLDSTNGTFHGASRVGSIVVRQHARLRLGKHTHMDITAQDQSVALDDFGGDRFGEVFGANQGMQRLFALLSRVSPTDATLLLEGETGTGKEAIAEAVHQKSPRASSSFVVVDCGAIPRSLIGSELFGHIKGSFTSADADKPGLIESAEGGTLFLDEIGELDLDLQPQLLRVLEKREVRRIGESQSRRVDIRVIAATHRSLKDMVAAGQFREDLYYRLAVVRAVVPPLRERLSDIPLLAHHFAGQLGHAFELSPELIEQLTHHNWPGNVRELRNVVERALSLGQDTLPPSPGDLANRAPAGTDPGSHASGGPQGAPSEMLDMPFKQAKNALIESFERDYLVHLLRRHRGNISRAAQAAGIDRNYIHRLVKKYGITVERT